MCVFFQNHMCEQFAYPQHVSFDTFAAYGNFGCPICNI